jgi:hypothetical protein
LGMQITKSTGAFANVAFGGGAASTADIYPMIVSRSQDAASSLAVTNTNGGASGSARVAFIADTGAADGGDITLHPTAATTHAYTDTLAIRSHSGTKGISLLAAGTSPNNIRFYNAGGAVGDLTAQFTSTEQYFKGKVLIGATAGDASSNSVFQVIQPTADSYNASFHGASGQSGIVFITHAAATGSDIQGVTAVTLASARPVNINPAGGVVNLGSSAVDTNVLGGLNVNGATIAGAKMTLRAANNTNAFAIIDEAGGSGGGMLFGAASSGGNHGFMQGLQADGAANAPLAIQNCAKPLTLGNSSQVTTLKTNALTLEAYTTCATIGTDGSGVLICTPSDETLKKDIVPFARGLEAIQDLTPKTFKFKDPSDKNIEHSGFIAQNVAKSIPEAVRLNPEGKMQLDYWAIVAAQTNAINELRARLEVLEGGKVAMKKAPPKKAIWAAEKSKSVDCVGPFCGKQRSR